LLLFRSYGKKQGKQGSSNEKQGGLISVNAALRFSLSGLFFLFQ